MAVMTAPSEKSHSLSEDLSTAAHTLLEKFAEGSIRALNFMSRPRFSGRAPDMADRDIILHYALRELVRQTLQEPAPENEKADLSRKVQWESAFAVMLKRSEGDGVKAARSKILLKAFDGLVSTPEQAQSLEAIFIDVAGGRAPERALARTLSNELEGRVTALEEEVAGQVPPSSRRVLEEFGRILASRFCVGGDAAYQFLSHELDDVSGLNAMDREAVIYFATRSLLSRTAERVESGDKQVLTTTAGEWAALFECIRLSWKAPQRTVQPHTPVVRAFTRARIEGVERSTLEKVFSKLERDEHRMLAKHFIDQSKPLPPEQRLAA